MAGYQYSSSPVSYLLLLLFLFAGRVSDRISYVVYVFFPKSSTRVDALYP
jgi:hypothetical protein